MPYASFNLIWESTWQLWDVQKSKPAIQSPWFPVNWITLKTSLTQMPFQNTEGNLAGITLIRCWSAASAAGPCTDEPQACSCPCTFGLWLGDYIFCKVFLNCFLSFNPVVLELGPLYLPNCSQLKLHWNAAFVFHFYEMAQDWAKKSSENTDCSSCLESYLSICSSTSSTSALCSWCFE